VTFACDRCASPEHLADPGALAGGLQATCAQCGRVVVAAPRPPHRPPPLPPPLPRRTPATPVDGPDRFLTDTDPHPGTTTAELVLSLKAHAPGWRPALAAGLLLAVGLAGAGAWWASRSQLDGGASGDDGERRGGSPAGRLDEPSPSVRDGRARPPVSGAALPPEPSPPQGGTSLPLGGPPRSGPAAASPVRPGRAGRSIGRRDRKLLDLLDRKQDAPGMSVPAAGELSTGHASLDGATVRGALSSHASAFSACIARAAKAEPGVLQGRRALVLELVVQPSGLVTRATVEDPRTARSALGRCLVAAARRMVFPSFAGEELVVQAPLRLSAVQ
jgi:hypothetical protein